MENACWSSLFFIYPRFLTPLLSPALNRPSNSKHFSTRVLHDELATAPDVIAAQHFQALTRVLVSLCIATDGLDRLRGQFLSPLGNRASVVFCSMALGVLRQ